MAALLLLLSTTPAAAPAGYDALIEQAMQLRNAGDFAAAEQSLRSARGLASETNEVDSLLGMMLAFQERMEEALTVLDDALSRYPDDIPLTLAKARVLSYTGDHGQSLSLAGQVLEALPEHLEAILLAARVSFYLQELESSRRYYSRALDLEPANTEALLGLYDVEFESGNRAVANQLLDRIETTAPTLPGLAVRRERRDTTVTGKHEISTGIAASNITGARLSNWYDRSMEYRYHSQGGSQVYFRTEHLHRFGDHDTVTEAGAVVDIGLGQPTEIAIAYGDNADFSPEKRIRLATTLALPGGTSRFGTTLLDLGYTHAEFLSGDVDMARLGVTHYFSRFEGWLSSGLLGVEDENDERNIGWTASLHWQISSRTRLGYGYTDAPETENNITTETRTHHVYASYQLSRHLAVRLDGARNDRQNSYSRESLSLSLQFRF